MDYLLLPFLSFFVGIVVGLTGIGGASLITPMLIFVFQVPPAIAVSSDIWAATLMKVVGGFKHWRQQTLDLKIVKWLAMGSVPGALSGVGILHSIRRIETLDFDSTLLKALGFTILLVTAIGLTKLLLLVLFPNVQLPELPKFDLETHSGRALTMGVGAFLGCLVGLTSVSSGSLFALALMTFFQLDAKKLVGTDLSQAGILLSFTSLGHLTLGTVNWSLVGLIWLGSVPGVLVGAQLCQFVPQRTLQTIIYSLLMMISLKLVY